MGGTVESWLSPQVPVTLSRSFLQWSQAPTGPPCQLDVPDLEDSCAGPIPSPSVGHPSPKARFEQAGPFPWQPGQGPRGLMGTASDGQGPSEEASPA